MLNYLNQLLKSSKLNQGTSLLLLVLFCTGSLYKMLRENASISEMQNLFVLNIETKVYENKRNINELHRAVN